MSLINVIFERLEILFHSFKKRKKKKLFRHFNALGRHATFGDKIYVKNNDSCTPSVQLSYNIHSQGVGPTVYGAHPL
jgi:hypothetical protein